MSEHRLSREEEQSEEEALLWKACRASPEMASSEVARELALFTAVEGRVVEEGAGGAAPWGALVLLLHQAAAHVCQNTPRHPQHGRQETSGPHTRTHAQAHGTSCLEKIDFFGETVDIDQQ